VELINWVLEIMKNPYVQVCPLIETSINQFIDEINSKNSIVEANPLDNELRILDWILFIYCSNEIDFSSDLQNYKL
jgi:hypothetical protein